MMGNRCCPSSVPPPLPQAQGFALQEDLSLNLCGLNSVARVTVHPWDSPGKVTWQCPLVGVIRSLETP